MYDVLTIRGQERQLNLNFDFKYSYTNNNQMNITFHLKRSLVNPPAVEDATSLWYEIVMVVEDFTSLD